jgi:predicted kinase
VLTVGLPGSGKSTFARRLAPRIDAVILESDVLRRLLFGEPTYGPGESRLLFRAMHRAAYDLLRRGIAVIIDATSLTESDRQPVHELAEAARVRLVVVHLRAPFDVIEERLQRRMTTPDPDDHSKADISVYHLMAAREEPFQAGAMQIDTSDASALEAAIERIVTDLRKTPAVNRRLGGRP